MLYLLGVYALVVIIVFLPIVFFYIVIGVSWVTLAAVRLLVQHVKNASAIWTDFLSKPHWNTIRR
jgi:hypothetical protein